MRPEDAVSAGVRRLAGKQVLLPRSLMAPKTPRNRRRELCCPVYDLAEIWPQY